MKLLNNNYLLIHLYNGESYNEISQDEDEYILHTKFDNYNLSLDLSSFQMERTTSDRFSNRAKTMNINQLKNGIDSLKNEKMKFQKNILQNFTHTNNTTNYVNINQKISEVSSYKNNQQIIIKKINKFKVELHRKLTLAIACIMMLMIGGSIGAIIKKGGFGLTVIFSTILFLLYHVLSITGEKMVKKDVIEPIIGMWGPTCIMLMVGLGLMINVNNNSSLIKKT